MTAYANFRTRRIPLNISMSDFLCFRRIDRSSVSEIGVGGILSGYLRREHNPPKERRPALPLTNVKLAFSLLAIGAVPQTLLLDTDKRGG